MKQTHHSEEHAARKLAAIARRLAWVAALALAPMTAHAQLLSLPDAPPFLSTQVSPNVMLLLDNSEGMDNIVWAPGYDPQISYQDYSTSSCGETNDVRCWFARQSSVLLELDGELAPLGPVDCAVPPGPRANCNNLPASLLATTLGHGPERGACAEGFREGKLNGTGPARCLQLPDPAGNGRTRYAGNYLNYLFDTQVADNASADIRSLIPNRTRLQVAKSVSSVLVSTHPELRFGLASFNPPAPGDPGPGGSINAMCGADQATLLTAINGLTANANAPLAETMYEITRYFRGQARFQGLGADYVSPVRLRCQKNFVVAITQGFPTYDRTLPNDDPADLADDTRALPDWDGRAPATTAAQFPSFPAGSDGYGGVETGAEGQSLFFDDLAKFAFDIDLRTGATDGGGASFDDPLFPQQNLRTYTVGFAGPDQMLRDAAGQGQGQHFSATDLAGLNAALQGAVSDIATTSGSLSSATLNSTILGADTRLFQASFNSADWRGDLRATPISTGPGGPCPPLLVGLPCPDIAWSAAAKLDAAPPASRTVLSYDLTARTGIPFRWASLPPQQQALLNLNANAFPATVTVDARGAQRVDYLRGDRSQEGANNFRLRGSRLGDIVGSEPVFVGAPDAAYRFPGYAEFRAAENGRTPVVYVGANDGMLHGFDADTGAEVLAYVPGKLYGTAINPKLARLTAQPYRHVFAVDGSPAVADVEIGTTWASYLVGGLRSGGQGLFALDVTQPRTFTEGNAASLVKWEFTDADDPDLGYTFSQPRIARMKNGRWAAIVGNGYNSGEDDGSRSASERAALFIVFVDGPGADGVWNAGSDYLKLTVGPTGQDNGLATAAPIDLDGDNVADYIFAGDLQGNMWQFNVTGADAASWAVAYSGVPLFAAGATQPITSPPEVGPNPLTTDPDDVIVYFGTGQFIEADDNRGNAQETQTFYGIFANPRSNVDGVLSDTATSPAAARSELLQQAVLAEPTTLAGDRVRVTSQRAIDPQLHKGWFIDLIGPMAGNLGERHVNRPILRDARIVFTTLIPSGNDDECDVRGSGWLLELDSRSGGRPARPALDITHNLTVDRNDVVEVTLTEEGGVVKVPVSGIASETGILSTPAILAITPGSEVKYSARSDGTTAVFGEAGLGRAGRVTWRELLP